MRDHHIGSAILNFETDVIYDLKNLRNDRIYFATHSQETNTL